MQTRLEIFPGNTSDFVSEKVPMPSVSGIPHCLFGETFADRLVQPPVDMGVPETHLSPPCPCPILSRIQKLSNPPPFVDHLLSAIDCLRFAHKRYSEFTLQCILRSALRRDKGLNQRLIIIIISEQGADPSGEESPELIPTCSWLALTRSLACSLAHSLARSLSLVRLSESQ